MTNGDEPANGPRRLIEAVFPAHATKVFWAAIVVGMTLVVLGLAVPSVDAELQVQANMLLSGGIGIVFAAFGSQATVKIGRAVVIGAAAIALVLYYVMEKSHKNWVERRIEVLNSSYVRGNIRSADPRKFQSIIMYDNAEFVGGYLPRGRVYGFVLLSDLPQINFVTLGMETGAEEPQNFAIHRSCLDKVPGQVRQVEWELAEGTVREGDTQLTVPALREQSSQVLIAVASDRSQSKPCTVMEASAPVAPMWSNHASLLGVRAAFAQKSYANFEPTAEEVAEAISQLTDDNTLIRRNARSTLSYAAPSEFRAILDAMLSTERNHPDNYRLVLGGSVAFALMMRRDPTVGKQIAAVLTDADIDLLVEATGHPDRTMRSYATEVLVGLEDPRVARKALESALKTENENARYNLILSAETGWQVLDDGEKATLSETLKELNAESGNNTRQLLEQYQFQPAN